MANTGLLPPISFRVNFKDVLYIMPFYLRPSFPEFRISNNNFCSSCSRNVRLHAATLQISPSLISPKNAESSSSSSTPRTSNSNPSSAVNNPEPPKARSPLLQFRLLKPAGLKECLQSTRKRKLKNYTVLAGHLAGEGHMLEFVQFLEVCVHCIAFDYEI